jgi:signal transduction histidine kinase
MIKNSLNRLSGLTKHLTSFARAQQRPVISLGSINKVINDVLSLIELNIKKKRIILMVSLDENLSFIYLSPLHLEQAVMNVLMNAIDAVEEGTGVIKIKTFQERNWAYITIEDNGPGIPEHIRNQVFEAFVTTKPAGVGTGLGLNVAKDMISSLKGEIELLSEHNAGTKAVIKLPILSQEEIA